MRMRLRERLHTLKYPAKLTSSISLDSEYVKVLWRWDKVERSGLIQLGFVRVLRMSGSGGVTIHRGRIRTANLGRQRVFGNSGGDKIALFREALRSLLRCY